MYKLAVPHDALLPYIEHYWAVFANPGEVVDLAVNVYVDARADLIFNFGDPYLRGIIGQHPAKHFASNLDAQRDVPITIIQRGAVAIAGARFRTGGVAPFLRQPMDLYTNRTPGIAEVFGEDARAIEASLRERVSSIDGQKELLDAFFLARLKLDEPFIIFNEVKARIEQEGGIVPVERTSRDAGISPRNLGRLFGRYIGFSPKHFARIARFQNALRILMKDAETGLGELSAKCGYFDQSHFIKDFRRFTGGVPRGYKGYYPSAGPADFAPNVVRFLQDGETG